MLRLQAPLPDRYTRASAEQLDEWIGTAKASLGDQLLILGHHYQRDEVIKWADARGDSFNLARFAADNRRATAIVFCGVHFMAESADVLTGSHQRVILPDLNAGCSMADMADIDQVEECWDALATVTDVERASDPRMGAGRGRPRPLLSRPTPRAQHRVRHGPHRNVDAGVGSASRARRARGARREGRDLPPLEGALLGAPALPPRAHRRI